MKDLSPTNFLVNASESPKGKGLEISNDPPFSEGNFAVSFREYISASESMRVLFWKITAFGR